MRRRGSGVRSGSIITKMFKSLYVGWGCMDELGGVSVELPPELARRLDAFVEENPWGFRNRSEVIRQAVRDLLRWYEADGSVGNGGGDGEG